MKRNRLLLGACALLALAACGGGGSDTQSGVSFVRGQIARTSETTDPVEINDLDLRFPENTAAFDSLFQ